VVGARELKQGGERCVTSAGESKHDKQALLNCRTPSCRDRGTAQGRCRGLSRAQEGAHLRSRRQHSEHTQNSSAHTVTENRSHRGSGSAMRIDLSAVRAHRCRKHPLADSKGVHMQGVRYHEGRRKPGSVGGPGKEVAETQAVDDRGLDRGGGGGGGRPVRHVPHRSAMSTYNKTGAREVTWPQGARPLQFDGDVGEGAGGERCACARPRGREPGCGMTDWASNEAVIVKRRIRITVGATFWVQHSLTQHF